jgi:uncharacterized protein YbjT (DUF2867 family)
MDPLADPRLAEAMTTTHLIIGGTGKTGRRVLHNLTQRGLEVRALSRPEFDWEDRGTWSSVEGRYDSAYLTFAPDVAFPGAPETVAEVARRVLASGTKRLVLLSGRGEPEAQRAEGLVADLAEEYGAEWAVVRCAFFMQNFSEGFVAGALASGHLAFPADTVREPFVDVDDIAAVATGLMVGEIPAGRAYELTGPRLLTFAEATAAIAAAAGRPIDYSAITVPEFVDDLVSAGLPLDDARGLGGLFAEILDGHNSHLADGVRQALGREARDFTEYARAAAANGAWAVAADTTRAG